MRDHDRQGAGSLETVPAGSEAAELRRRISELKAAANTSEHRLARTEQMLQAAEERLAQEQSERVRAQEASERRALQARLIYEVGRQVSSELELDELFEAIVTTILDAFGYYSVILASVEREAGHLTLGAAAGGLKETFPKGTVVPMGVGMVGHAAATGQTQLSGDVSQNPHYIRLENEETRSELVVPIKSSGKVIGVLDLQSIELDAFDQTDVMLIETLADQVAVAMENAKLYQQAQREIRERVRAEEELRKHQERLEVHVEQRTAQLKASEERYRTLFDGIPVGLYRTTPAGQFLDANLALVDMFGYPNRQELLALNLADSYLDPADRLRWQALMAAQEVVRDFQARLQRHDGTAIWINDTARAVKDQDGQVLFYEGSIENITERKEAEAQLRRYREQLEQLVEERTAELQASEERLRTLFDGVPIGLYRTTPGGQVLDFNLAMAQMLGYTPEEAATIANPADEVYVDPDDRLRWQALIEKQGTVRDFEQRLRRQDGQIIWVNDTARVVKDERGNVLYYEGSLEDITERKRIQQEIRRQKDYYEALFVNSPVAIMTADRQATVISWNPAAEKLFGYTANEAIGRCIDDLVAADPRVRQEAQGYTSELFNTDRLHVTSKRTRKDGSLVDVEILALPAIVAGEKAGYIAIYHDVGELLQARREAESANQAKSVFLANMSHELRTPLNAILGFTQLMDGDDNLTPGQQENLEIVNQSGEHLLALINDVLEMSKIESGQVRLREAPFDLHLLLESLEEMFQFQAEQKGLELTFEVGEDVPRYVCTDQGKLRQVVSNLLGNAVKFTQDGGVRLAATARPGGARHLRLQFDVHDTGPGIAADDLEAVFDPFVQARQPDGLMSAHAPEGTGLGLTISRQFIRLMGGDISVSSRLGVGSQFSFHVLATGAEADQIEGAPPRPEVIGLAPGQPPWRLLVVEDRQTNRRLLVKMLEQLGFDVLEARDGQEAIDLWRQWDPHLIWMDMRMPVMNGLDATRRIKALPGGDSVVIIALTATAFDEDREQILLEGCDDFLRKPVRKDEIVEALIKHLEVEFVYRQERDRAADAVTSPSERLALDPGGQLARQPQAWRDALRQAAVTADYSQLLELIEASRPSDPVLADRLRALAEDFQYPQIVDLVDAAGGPR